MSKNDTPPAAFSRSGHTNTAGKLTQRIDVPVTDELNDAISALATINGTPRSEWVRALLEKTVFGELGMVRRMTRTNQAVDGINV